MRYISVATHNYKNNVTEISVISNRDLMYTIIMCADSIKIIHANGRPFDFVWFYKSKLPKFEVILANLQTKEDRLYNREPLW